MSVPTAEEVIDKMVKFASVNDTINCTVYSLSQVMIEFAKFHVEEALKEASEKATVTPIDHEEISEGSFRPIWGVDDDSIINSYPLDLIK